MREVKIDDNGTLDTIHCPMGFNAHYEDGGVMHHCIDSCAWFSKRNHPLDKIDIEHAYCRDTCIGKIESE